MTSTPIGIGIIGTGFGATVQLPAFLTLPDVRVIGLASRHPATASAIAHAHGLTSVFSSPEELIHSPDVDVVSIATPQSTHAALVSAALTANKAVLCEKPFTLSTVEAQSLVHQADATNVFHAVDFEFRELPSWQMLKTQIDQGVLGRLIDADFRWISGSWASRERPWGWQCDASQGGGVVSALGVHFFDAVEWMLAPVASLSATTSITVKERLTRDGALMPVTAEENATVTLTLIDGMPVHMALSNVDVTGTGFSITIRGEKAVLRLVSTSKQYGRGERVMLIHNGVETVLLDSVVPEKEDPRIILFRRFADRMMTSYRRGDRVFSPSFREGLRTRMILDAVLQSQGSNVDILRIST